MKKLLVYLRPYRLQAILAPCFKLLEAAPPSAGTQPPSTVSQTVCAEQAHSSALSAAIQPIRIRFIPDRLQ